MFLVLSCLLSVCDGLEFKPHLRGSWGHGPNQHKRAVPRRGHGAKSLTSTGMLPHCVHEGPSTLGLSRWKPPAPRGATHTVRFQCIGLEHRRLQEAASLRYTSRKWQTWKKYSAPTHPTVAPPQEDRWHTISRVGRENAKQCSSKATPCSSPEGFGELRQVAHGIGVRWARVQATSQGVMGTRP